MELLQIKCPTCHSAVLQSHTTYATQHHGRRILYKCTNCPTYFSETKQTLMAGLKTPVSVIWQVIKARTEGMGLNAAARTFDRGYAAARTRSRAGNASCRPWRMRRRLSCRQVHP